MEIGVSRIIIIGTETLHDLNFVKQMIKSFGKDRIIVSIDLKERELISRSEAIKFMSPISLAKTLSKMNVTRLIVLDLEVLR